ncbi:MAG: hypothetical protein GY820_09890 [Gammaproteobacteria bacterium]|nr:hypothetical protein [Gammaproteobacteria bacterium]
MDRAFVSHWLHRNEIQWVQGWSTTEDWIEHVYQLAAPKLNAVGARLVHHRELDRAFVSHWLHRNELQCVSDLPTTENWIEHLYHIGYTEMKYSGCKVDPPQRTGSSICITLATPK